MVSRWETITFTVLLSLSIFIINTAFSETNSSSVSPDCTKQMMAKESDIASSINKTRAIFIVENSTEYKSKLQGYSASPVVYEEWITNTAACSVNLQDVGVTFFLKDSNGNGKTILVTLDPNLNKILTSVIRDSLFYGHGPNDTAIPEFPIALIVLIFGITAALAIAKIKRIQISASQNN